MLHRVSILVVAYRLSVAGCGDCGSEGWVFLLDWPFEACFGMFATESVMRCYGAFVFLDSGSTYLRGFGFRSSIVPAYWLQGLVWDGLVDPEPSSTSLRTA